MTREEAIGNLAHAIRWKDMPEEDALDMAIKALEQHPCEDCISRQAALECLDWKYPDKLPKTKIIELPPVTPQPKIGRWIMKHRTHNVVNHYTGQDEMGETHTISVLERYEVNKPYCSECGKLAGDTSQNYCCACGAKMEVETDDRS